MNEKCHEIIMLERILEIIIIHSLILYPGAYRGNVIYLLSGIVELELRTSDCQYAMIQLLKSNPETNSLQDFKRWKSTREVGGKLCHYFFLYTFRPPTPRCQFPVFSFSL